jgi:hypothetical protein
MGNHLAREKARSPRPGARAAAEAEAATEHDAAPLLVFGVALMRTRARILQRVPSISAATDRRSLKS